MSPTHNETIHAKSTAHFVFFFELGGCAQSLQSVESSQTELTTETQNLKEPGRTKRSAAYISCSQNALDRLAYTRCQNAELEKEDIRLNQEYQSAMNPNV